MDVQIGQKVWVDTEDNLVFRRTRDYNDAIKEMLVVSEDKKHWQIGYEPGRVKASYINVDKVTLEIVKRKDYAELRKVFFSEGDLKDAIWIRRNRRLLVDALRLSDDATALRTVAQLLGVKTEEVELKCLTTK